MDFTPTHPVPDFPHKEARKDQPKDDQPFAPQNKPFTAAPASKPAWQRMVLLAGGIFIIGALLAATLYTQHARPGVRNTNTAVTTPASSSTPGTSATPVSATDNASLQKDLGGVNSSLTASSKSQSDADSGLSDSSSQIDVPTN